MLTARHTQDTWRTRVRGCLLGGALGDAVGRPFEGRSGVTRDAVRAALEEPALTWTDDTALLLALADYLAGLDDCTAVDDEELVRRFATAWHADPGRGYGANPPRVFATALDGGDWRRVAAASFDGAGSLGNGGAMRAAPVGALPLAVHEVAAVARRTAAVTHAHPEGQDGAVVIALAAWVCLRTEPQRLDPPALVSAVTAQLGAPRLVAATEAVLGTVHMTDPASVARVTGTGIAAAEAAPAALAAFLHHPHDPVAAITFAVSMGGDTDTIATMAGALSGALAGAHALPEAPLRRLEQASGVRDVADALAARTHRAAGTPGR